MSLTEHSINPSPPILLSLSLYIVGEVPRRRWFRRRVPTARVSLGNAARLGALLILGLVGSYYLDRQLIQRAPSRVVSDLPDFSYSLGRFTVAWDRSAAQLSVVHKRYWCISQCTVQPHTDVKYERRLRIRIEPLAVGSEVD